jgi:hypothetical protein
MSAIAVKVSPDKQTLILAGEAIPPPRANADRGVSGSEMRVQLQRVTMLLVQGDYASTTLVADSGASKSLAVAGERVLLPPVVAVDAPPMQGQHIVPYLSPKRAVSAGGAAEYARMQNLSGDRSKSQVIDTYA